MKDVQCMGRLLASATHDMRNVLAVIRESAGLAADMIALAAEKGGLEHGDRLAAAMREIQQQVIHGAELAEGIEKTVFKTPVCPVYQNVTALPSTDPETIKKNLLAQLTSPVKWTQTVKNMLADGAGYFMEIGPGTVLQGLVKKIAGADVTIEGISALN